MRRDVSFAPSRTTVSPLVGGVAGVVYPLLLVTVAFSVGFRTGGGMGDFAASVAAAVLFVIAAPTAWVLSFSFIEVSRVVVFSFAILTSFPIWILVGRGIASRSPSWTNWARVYGVVCVGWTAANLVLFGIVATIIS